MSRAPHGDQPAWLSDTELAEGLSAEDELLRLSLAELLGYALALAVGLASAALWPGVWF